MAPWPLRGKPGLPEAPKTLDSVHAVLQGASDLVGYPDASKVCAAMEAQHITHVWQLHRLDPSEWKDLGAPMGLRAAVWQLLEGGQPSERRAPTLLEGIAALPKGSAPECVRSGSSPPERQPRRRSRILSLVRLTTVWDWIVPFDHQRAFKRAIIHAKGGEELKAYLTDMCEAWAMVLALLLGCSVGVWSMVGNEGFESLESDVALYLLTGYHCVHYFNVLFLFLAIVLFMVLAIVGGTVPPASFRSWMLLHLDTIQAAEIMMVLSSWTWVLTLAGFIHASIELTCPGRNMLFHVVVASMTLCLLNYTFVHINCLARVTFHTGQMHQTASTFSSGYISQAVLRGARSREVEDWLKAEAASQTERDVERCLLRCMAGSPGPEPCTDSV